MTAEELVVELEKLFNKPLRLPCPATEEAEGEYNLRMIEHFVAFTRYKAMSRGNLFDTLAAKVAQGKTLDYENLYGWPRVPERYYK